MKNEIPLDEIARELQNIRLEIAGIKPEAIESIIASSVAALVVDMQTRKIIHSTPLADSLFGYIQGELTGKNLNDLIPTRFHLKHDTHVNNYSQNPEQKVMGERNMQLLGKHKDGREIKVEISLHPRAFAGKRFVIATILKAR